MDFIKKDAILLNMNGSSKDEIVKEMLLHLESNSLISDHEECLISVNKREEILSTALENEIALPHASCRSVKEPFLAIGTSKKGVLWDEALNAKIFLFVLTPLESSSVHLKMLAETSSILLEKNNVEIIKNAESIDEIYNLFKKEEVDENVLKKGFLIGVTGCPTGIAHTYLAEKALISKAHEMGYDIKVETNGSIGVENSPSDEEIQKALAIIVASDKQVELDRFDSKKVLFSSVKSAINNPQDLIERSLKSDIYHGENKKQEKSSKNSLYVYLMNGVSYMIPFVIIGGILIALSLALGGKATPEGLQIPKGSFYNHILNVGVAAFTLMIPILAGYIAMAIGDRPALAAGMVGGYIAANGSFYNSKSGMGFLGAILAGLLVGYFVKYMKKIKFPKLILPIVPIMIIPITATIFISGLFIFVIGAPIAGIMDSLYSLLENMSTGGILIMGIFMGLLQGLDYGGPFGKVVFMFNIAMISQGHPEFMGAQAVAIPVAPLGMGLATILDRGKKVFSEEEHGNGTAALAMGLVGISEGAIPFAAAKPLAVIPATMIGSSVACALAMLFGITNPVPHGGPIILLLGVVNKPFIALMCMIIGSCVTAFITLFLRKFMSKN